MLVRGIKNTIFSLGILNIIYIFFFYYTPCHKQHNQGTAKIKLVRALSCYNTEYRSNMNFWDANKNTIVYNKSIYISLNGHKI